jgi:hypothetical protein
VNSKRRLLLCSCALLAAGLAGSAMAQTLYKSTDRDGRVSYADEPAPGAVKVERLQVVPATPDDPVRAAAESERLRQQAEQTRERERQREAALNQAHAEVLAALDALKQAQQRREAGVEPLPGERLGLRGGGSRLAPSYFARQRDLDREVNEAQQSLDKAYARRNEFR